MILGKTGTGKTTIHEILRKALNIINEFIKEEDKIEEFKPIKHFLVNPKALTLNNLYGYTDL
jgi:hypothetical protein